MKSLLILGLLLFVGCDNPNKMTATINGCSVACDRNYPSLASSDVDSQCYQRCVQATKP
jgi:hypothetical protein